MSNEIIKMPFRGFSFEDRIKALEYKPTIRGLIYRDSTLELARQADAIIQSQEAFIDYINEHVVSAPGEFSPYQNAIAIAKEALK